MKFKLPIIKIAATFLVCLFIFSCNSNSDTNETSERSKININDNWSYLENDTENISDALNAENWQEIN